MLWSIDSSQNGVSRAQVSTHRGRVFFEVICCKVTSFQMKAGWSAFFLILVKYVVFMSLWHSIIKILIETDFERENSASYLKLQAGKTFPYCDHALITLYVQFLFSDCSKFDRWAQAENLCSILKLVYFGRWSRQSFVSTCDVFNCVFPLDVMKYSCYQESSVIHGWFVYWVFGWEMRRLSKSEIRFRLASFSFFTLLDAGLKVSSDSGLNTVAFRSCISNGKPEELLYLMFGFFISNFMKSITVYAASLCTFVRFGN